MTTNTQSSSPSKIENAGKAFLVVCGLFGILSCIYFGGYQNHFLYKAQDFSLFLFRETFLTDTLARPGGLLTYISLFFTACCAEPICGALLLSLVLSVLAYTVYRVFHVSHRSFFIAFIPSLAVVWSLSHINYYLYQFFDTSFIFSFPLGLLGAVLLYDFAKRSSNWIYSLIGCTLGYFLMGFFALFAGLLLVIHLPLKSKGHARWGAPCLLLYLSFLPFITYRFLYFQSLYACYFSPIPRYDLFGPVVQTAMLPALALLVLFLLSLRKASATSYPLTRPHIAIQLMVLLALAGLTFASSYRDKIFRTELEVQRYIEAHDWEGTYQRLSQIENPTRALIAYKAIAADYTGRLCDQFFDGFVFYNSYHSAKPFDDQKIYTPTLSLYAGFINDCYYRTMESMDYSSPNRQILMLLTQCALCNRETALAKKYLSLLKAAPFHRKEVETFEKYVNHPELFQKDPVYARICEQMPKNDVLANDGFTLLYYYLNLETGNQVDFVRSMITGLYLCQIEVLTSHTSFLNTIFKDQIPKHIQEALVMIDLSADTDFTTELHLDANIKQRAISFMQQSKDLSLENMESLRKDFGDTYYYYYFSKSTIQ